MRLEFQTTTTRTTTSPFASPWTVKDTCDFQLWPTALAAPCSSRACLLLVSRAAGLGQVDWRQLRRSTQASPCPQAEDEDEELAAPSPCGKGISRAHFGHSLARGQPTTAFAPARFLDLYAASSSSARGRPCAPCRLSPSPPPPRYAATSARLGCQDCPTHCRRRSSAAWQARSPTPKLPERAHSSHPMRTGRELRGLWPAERELAVCRGFYIAPIRCRVRSGANVACLSIGWAGRRV